MREILKADLPEFARCLTEKMMIYALGRGLERYDRSTVSQITRKLTASGYQFQTLIHQVVESVPFQMRRGEAVAAENRDRGNPKEVARK
jgi:hypothetical protein